jgi:hypothetical protein
VAKLPVFSRNRGATIALDPICLLSCPIALAL